MTARRLLVLASSAVALMRPVVVPAQQVAYAANAVSELDSATQAA